MIIPDSLLDRLAYYCKSRIKAEDKMNFRKYTDGTDAWARGIILNFSENGNHGCRFNCPYCSWKNQPESKMWLCPSDESLENFLKDYDGFMVTISGGGDPLYNYEKNSGELNRIIDKIHSMGFLVEIITRELDVLINNPDLVEKIDMFCFSTDDVTVIDNKIIDVIKCIKDSRDRVRISKVISPGEICTHFYDKRVADDYPIRRIILRENYKHKNTAFEMERIMMHMDGFLVYLPTNICSMQILLIGDKVRNCTTEPFVYD